jgi:hypothetical protein
MKPGLTVLLAALICVSLAPLALADAIACSGFSSELTVASLATGDVTGDFGTVCVTNFTSNTTQTALITFTAASGYGFIDSQIADISTTGHSATGSNPTGTPALTSPDFANNGDVNGFGAFDVTLNNGDASTSISVISFTVTNNSSTPWTGVGDVLAFNTEGFDAAAHVRCDSCDLPGQTGKTFYVAENTAGTTVPEPRFYGLLLVGLMGVVGIMLRRHRASSTTSLQKLNR